MKRGIKNKKLKKRIKKKDLNHSNQNNIIGWRSPTFKVGEVVTQFRGFQEGESPLQLANLTSFTLEVSSVNFVVALPLSWVGCKGSSLLTQTIKRKGGRERRVGIPSLSMWMLTLKAASRPRTLAPPLPIMLPKTTAAKKMLSVLLRMSTRRERDK